MTLRGINLDASNPSGSPDPSALKAANFNAVRLVNKAPTAEQYAAACKGAGLFVLDAITAESHGQLLASADLHEIRNEIDIASPSSEGMIPPDQYAQEVIAYAGSNPDRKFILGSLAAGDFSASYLRAVLPVLQDPNLSNVVGFAIHPYAKDLTQTRSLIAAHQQACIDVLDRDLQVFVTEWNRPASEIPGYDWWLRTSTAGAWWFAWSDGMVPGFGLNDAQRAAFKPFSNSTTPVPAPAPKPAPVPAKCWDRAQLITAGFSPTDAGGFCADFGTRRTIEAIVYHDMEGYLPGALARWNAGAAGAHLCILKNGTVVLTCRLEDVAWHAGTGNDPNSGVYGRTPFWRQHNLNPHSVGIELEGFADARDGGYTAAQRASLRHVTDWLCAKYGIVRKHTTDQVAGLHLHGELSTSRTDPGPTWNWTWVL